MALRRSTDHSVGRAHLQRFALVICLALPALLALGVLVNSRMAPGHGMAHSEAHADLMGTPLPTSGAVTPAYRFARDERLIYSVDYASTSASDLRVLLSAPKPSNAKEKPAPSGLAHSFSTSLHGELVATLLDRTTDGALMVYSLRKAAVRLDVDGQGAVTEAEALQSDLSRDVFAVVDPQGRIVTIRFDPTVGNLSQSFARALLAMTQFTLPPPQASNRQQWEVQEDDPNGQYVARYQALPDSKSGPRGYSPATLQTFVKTKIRYLRRQHRTNASQVEVAATVKPMGRLVARFDVGSGRLVSLNGSESQVISVAGKTIAHAQNTVRMNYLGKETLAPAELAAMRQASVAREKVTSALPLSVTASEAASEAAIQRTELGEATLESLLADLAKLEASPEKEKEDTPVYLKFKALVYLHPETSARLGQILAASDPKNVTMRVLTGALGAVGHAEAQEALVTAIRGRPKDWPALSILIPSLGGVSSPSQLAEQALRGLASSPDADVASTAQLALGAMARSLAQTSPQRAAQIVDWAIQEMGHAASQDATRQWLLVLGNAGSVRALPALTRFMSNPSAELRAAAAAALRWIDSRQADDLLAKTLVSDSEAKVRLEAAVALGFRETTALTFEAQKRAFRTDKAVDVRVAAVNNLWKANEAFPEVRRLVQQAAAKDASKDVRKAARDIIEMNKEDFGVTKPDSTHRGGK